MYCYRIVRKKYASVLSGEGARLYGGRWNTKGTSMIYTAQTSSLAMLEMLVQRNVQLVGMDYYLITIDFPEVLLGPPQGLKNLLLTWDSYPPDMSTKIIGDAFIKESRHAVFSVPSAVNSLESNLLINDGHSDFEKVKIVSSKQIIFDHRLVQSY